MSYSLNLPNRITLARFVLSIVFFLLLGPYSYRNHSGTAWILDWAIVVFVIAAGTDFVDGYLARKHGLVTPLGRILDPFVDKVLICGAFILLAGPGFTDSGGINVTRVEAWMVVVIVARELLVTSIRGFQESVGKAFPASWHGKFKMWVQSISAPVILFLVAHGESFASKGMVDGLKLAFAWLTVIATVLSVFEYLLRSRGILEASAPA